MTDGGARGPLVSMLERIRVTFYVRAVTIRLLDEDGEPIDHHAGAPLPWPDDPLLRSLRSLAAGDIVIVPDIDLEAGAAERDRRPTRIRFFAGLPLLSETGRPFGALCLFHTRPRWLAPVHVRALENLAAQLAPLALRRRDAATIMRLKGRVEAQAADAVRDRDTFERAARAARIGMWECALRDQSLTWTDQVYDMFEIPRGAGLIRQKTLESYASASRDLLERVRSDALAQRRPFRLEAEITTPSGRTRWIRIDASVDCRDGRPTRLFGMKQDITEHRLLLDQTRLLAESDAMTGLANRSQFEKRLSKLDGANPGDAAIGTLMLIDLDGFKQVNDGFGHAIGDACIKEAARLLSEICSRADLVARIGGDEFAVLLGRDVDEAAVETLSETIVSVLGRPMSCAGYLVRIGASVGSARVSGPCSSGDLFNRADIALYAAKAAGRGTARRFAPDMGREGDRLPPWPVAQESDRGSSLKPTTH